MGVGKGGGRILKFSAIKVVFLVSSGKKIPPLLALLEKVLLMPTVPRRFTSCERFRTNFFLMTSVCRETRIAVLHGMS